MSDGLLDVILVRDLGAKSMASAVSSIDGKSVDGEMKGQTPLSIEVVPGVVTVVTPAQS